MEPDIELCEIRIAGAFQFNCRVKKTHSGNVFLLNSVLGGRLLWKRSVQLI